MIVAQNYRGHRLSYIRLLVDEVLRSGAHPILIAPEGLLDSREYSLHLSPIESAIYVVEVASVTVPAINEELPSGFTGPVVFPDGDQWLPRAARAPFPWHGETRLLVMRPAGQSRHLPLRTAQTAAKAALRGITRLRPRAQIFTLRSAAATALGRHEVRDPVTFSFHADRATEMRRRWLNETDVDDIYWFGIIGSLGERKNVSLVASALGAINDPKIGLVLLGRATPNEEATQAWTATLKGSRVHYFRDPSQLSDKDFDAAVAALDCLVLAHSNEGPSGVLGKAFAAGTRVVSAGAVSLRQDARLAPELASWVPLTQSALEEALSRASMTPAARAVPPEPQAFAQKLIGTRTTSQRPSL